MATQQRNQSTAALVMDYVEKGCLCLLEGKIEQQHATVSDANAVRHYEQKCRCSRNYVLDSGEQEVQQRRCASVPDD